MGDEVMFMAQSWLGTLPSVLARSMVPSVSVGSAGQWMAELGPRRHMMADLKSEKFILHLSQCSVLL